MTYFHPYNPLSQSNILDPNPLHVLATQEQSLLDLHAHPDRQDDSLEPIEPESYSVNPPPPYRGRPALRAFLNNRDQERRPSTEHTFSPPDLSEKNGWVQCRLFSFDSPKGAHPCYKPGDVISGVVELNSETEKPVQSIRLTLTGCIVDKTRPSLAFQAIHSAAALDTLPRPFLELHEKLWKHSMIDEANPPSKKSKSSHKLQGEYSFPFQLSLPEDLPPTFSSKSFSVVYTLLVSLRMPVFQQNISLSTHLAITPSTMPPLPSQTRELIYTCRSPIPPPPPEQDPEGWSQFSFPPGGRNMLNVLREDSPEDYILALANPLTYTRGHFVPLLVGLPTENPPFSLPKYKIHLFQTTVTPASKRNIKVASAKVVGTREQVNTEASGAGRIWTELEIPLSKELAPSFKFEDVEVYYTVSFSLKSTSGSGVDLDHDSDQQNKRKNDHIRIDIATDLAGPAVKPVSRLKHHRRHRDH